MSEVSYEVREGEGPATVCVNISRAPLERPVIVTVSTEDISALGNNCTRNGPNTTTDCAGNGSIGNGIELGHHRNYSADYETLNQTGILFYPGGPLMGCVDIYISRDDLVEYAETFRFLIDPYQQDAAVLVGSPNASIVTILDEEGGT